MLKHQGNNFQGREQRFYDRGFLTSLLKEAAFKVEDYFLTSGFKQPGSRRAGMWIGKEGLFNDDEH